MREQTNTQHDGSTNTTHSQHDDSSTHATCTLTASMMTAALIPLTHSMMMTAAFIPHTHSMMTAALITLTA